jgi:hypothetical protein
VLKWSRQRWRHLGRGLCRPEEGLCRVERALGYGMVRLSSSLWCSSLASSKSMSCAGSNTYFRFGVPGSPALPLSVASVRSGLAGRYR